VRLGTQSATAIVVVCLLGGCGSHVAAPDDHARSRDVATTAIAPRSRYTRAIYPAARSFPDWGYPSGCPSLRNVDPLHRGGNGGALHALRHLNGRRHHDRRWADRAYWPALVGGGHHDLDASRPGHHRSRRARASGYASLLENNCGRAIVRRSQWIATAPGDPRTHPGLARNYFLLHRRDHWLVWFTTP
jgi:hypothetical protein